MRRPTKKPSASRKRSTRKTHGLRLKKRRRSVRFNARKMKKTEPDAESGRTRDVQSGNVYVKSSENSTSKENENATSDMNVDDEKNARDIGIGSESETVTVIAVGQETGTGTGAGRGVGAEIMIIGTAIVIVIVDVTVHCIALSVLCRLVLVIRSQNNLKRPEARLLPPRNRLWTKSLSKRPHWKCC